MNQITIDLSNPKSKYGESVDGFDLIRRSDDSLLFDLGTISISGKGSHEKLTIGQENITVTIIARGGKSRIRGTGFVQFTKRATELDPSARTIIRFDGRKFTQSEKKRGTWRSVAA